jgi:hypothetical protein
MLPFRFFCGKVTSPIAGFNRKVFRFTMYFVLAYLGHVIIFAKKCEQLKCPGHEDCQQFGLF